jgi:FkbM family methyltransferase
MNPFKSLASALLPESALMHLRAADHYFNGEEELRLIPKICPRGKEAIDAGANIGTYSYFLRKYASRVHAFEPNPNLAKRLTKLMPDVHVRNAALSDEPRELVLQVPVDANGKMRHELASVAQKFDGQVTEFRVEGTTIDAEKYNNVGFIKIDVEQHERQVLRGAIDTIKRCRPVILLEVYPLKYEGSLAEEFAFVIAQDYATWFSFKGDWHPLASLDPKVHTLEANFGRANAFIGNNLLMYPQEHPQAKTGPKG